MIETGFVSNASPIPPKPSWYYKATVLLCWLSSEQLFNCHKKCLLQAKDSTVTEQPKSSSPGSKSPTESSPLAGNEPPSYDSVFPKPGDNGDSDQK